MIKDGILFGTLIAIDGIVLKLGKVVLKRGIPCLIEELWFLTKPEENQSHEDSSQGSQGSERSDSRRSSSSDDRRTRARVGFSVASETGCAVSTADTTPIIDDRGSVDGGRQTVTSQTGGGVTATDTTDVDSFSTHRALVSATVLAGGTITTLDLTGVVPTTSTWLAITSETRSALATTDSTDVDGLPIGARTSGGRGLGDVDGNAGEARIGLGNLT